MRSQADLLTLTSVGKGNSDLAFSVYEPFHDDPPTAAG
jgi:hypothetical protein